MPLRTGDRTAGMVAMDNELGGRGRVAEFIAARREPGESWRSFDAIARELTERTTIPITGPGVLIWAKRLGIPVDTTRKAEPADVQAYRLAVERYLRAPRGERTA